MAEERSPTDRNDVDASQPSYIIVIPENLAYHIEVKPQEIQEDDYGTEN